MQPASTRDTSSSSTTSSLRSVDVDEHFPLRQQRQHLLSRSGTVPTPQQKKSVRKQTSLAHIQVPSFSAFRSQVSATPVLLARRPSAQLPQPSPRPFYLAAEPSPRSGHPTQRPLSLDTVVASPLPSPLAVTSEATDSTGQRASHHILQRQHDRTPSIDSLIADFDLDQTPNTARPSSIPVHERYSDERSSSPASSHRPKHSTSSIDSIPQSSAEAERYRYSTSSMPNNKTKPSMTLEFNGVQRTLSHESLSTDDASDKRPKSPGRIGAFFGWKGSSPNKPGTESPTTTFSDRSLSPIPSPRQEKSGNNFLASPMARLAPAGLDIHKANSQNSRFFDPPETPILVDSPGMNAHVQEIERELSQVSAELANSIRREMDLEDEIERLKAEVPPSDSARRGSDYFSDSSASSVRFPISDPEAKLEEVERYRRKAEQDRAQLKVDMAQKLQLEHSRRRDLEERLEEMEITVDETRRRIGQEREAKENFEDLYSALQQEFASSRSERDNLRDNVVPQLKARIDALEAGSLAGPHGQSRFSSIAEESDALSTVGGPRGGLSRSGSTVKRAGSVNRSGSVKDRSEGGRQRSGSVGMTAEGLKEIEDQRDALHKALKLLINRHDKQQKDHERIIKKLTREQNAAEKATNASNSRRPQYHREVAVLKEEVTTLRKRTEDALDQKWQYEKSLGGIKMDLDRAEHETRGLRSLLREHDILAPSPRTLLGENSLRESTPVDSSLQHSMATAEIDRDHARRMADDFRQRAASAQQSSGASTPRAAQFQEAAIRMDDLAQQFDHQFKTNTELRSRLTDAIEKGEREQRQSTRQIEEMQKRLAGMEDSLLAAQQHSETTLTNHETEVRAIEEATSPRLQRLAADIPEPNKLSPISVTPGLLRSRSVGSKKVPEASLLDASRTQMLERKVRELERLLRDAEDDVQLVVQRVNGSQLEVAELTTERDAALTQMRKLQDRLVEETERAESLIGPPVRDDSDSEYDD